MIFKNDMLLYGWNPPGGIFGREFKLVADVPAAARPKKQQHCLRKRTRRMCVTEGTLHATTTHNWSLLSPRQWLENLVFPGINDKGTIPRMQYITIRASPRWKRGENICQSQDKREVGKRGLHAATKAQPFISGRLVSTSQLISLVHNLICQLLHYFSAPKERLCIKERVVLDLLVCLQNQKQWHLLLSSSHLSFPRRPNGVPRARLLLPSR